MNEKEHHIVLALIYCLMAFFAISFLNNKYSFAILTGMSLDRIIVWYYFDKGNGEKTK